MTNRLVIAAAVLAVAGCTRAPLTDRHIVLSGATRGEVPRDANGEPILDRVKPIPSNAILPATPPSR